MRLSKTISTSLLWLGMFAAVAVNVSSASILSPFSGIVRLEDDDVEGIIGSTDPFLQNGDFLVAVAQFPFLGEVGGPVVGFNETTNMLTAISLIKVSGDPVLDSGFGQNRAKYTFAAPTQAEWLALLGVAVSGDSTTLLAYDNPISNPHIDTSTIANAIATAGGGTLLYEFGLDGAAGTFWEAFTTVQSPLDPTNVANLVTGQGGGLQFAAALNLIVNHAGPAIEKHNYLSTVAGELPSFFGPADFTAPTHLQLYGTNGGSALPTSAELPLPTDSTAYINISAVPEPMSMVVWLGLTSAIGVSAYRRSRTA